MRTGKFSKRQEISRIEINRQIGALLCRTNNLRSIDEHQIPISVNFILLIGQYAPAQTKLTKVSADRQMKDTFLFAKQ